MQPVRHIDFSVSPCPNACAKIMSYIVVLVFSLHALPLIKHNAMHFAVHSRPLCSGCRLMANYAQNTHRDKLWQEQPHGLPKIRHGVRVLASSPAAATESMKRLNQSVCADGGGLRAVSGTPRVESVGWDEIARVFTDSRPGANDESARSLASRMPYATRPPMPLLKPPSTAPHWLPRLLSFMDSACRPVTTLRMRTVSFAFRSFLPLPVVKYSLNHCSSALSSGRLTSSVAREAMSDPPCPPRTDLTSCWNRSCLVDSGFVREK